MVGRGTGAVGCAHCTQIGAIVACQVCTRLVCERCSADWTTCNEPAAREVRLGRWARLRDVDPSGRFGLVSKGLEPLRLFDLRRLCWLRTPGLPRPMGIQLSSLMRVTSRAVLWHPRWFRDTSYLGVGFYEALSLVDGRSTHSFVDAPVGNAAVTAEDHFYFVTDPQKICAIDPRHQPRTFDPLPRKVVQAAHLDTARNLLASGTWGEICVHQIVDDTLVRVGHVATIGDLNYVQMAGPFIAACVDNRVYVWDHERDFSIGNQRYFHTFAPPIRASLSRDGRYLALGAQKKLLVHDLDNDTIENFEDDHTDDICLVRFAGTDNLLVTADDDNRVVIRPRTANGHARPKIAIEVPREPRDLELDDPQR